MRRGKVFCAGCANLFIIGSPMCMATAKFVEGPLRRKIDVVGATSAERRNIRNNCLFRVGVSLQAWRLKRWLLWRLNDDRKKQIKEVSLQDYPVKEEYDRQKEILGIGRLIDARKIDRKEIGNTEGRGLETENEELKNTAHDSSGEEEDVFSDGGVDNHNESGTSGAVNPEDVQDP